MNAKYCKNCGAEVTGNYCSHCGQRTTVHEVYFKEIFQDVLNTFFSTEAPFFRTLSMLFLNPGKLFREYLAGKRKQYYKPIAFFLLTTLVFIVTSNLIDYNPFARMAVIQTDNNDVDKLINVSFDYMVKNINNMLFIYVFTFAVVLRLFFYKQYRLVEYVAISFYSIGVYTLFTIISMLTLEMINPRLKMIPFITMIMYVVYMGISFFKSWKLGTIIKLILVQWLSYLLFSLLGGFLAMGIIWLKSN